MTQWAQRDQTDTDHRAASCRDDKDLLTMNTVSSRRIAEPVWCHSISLHPVFSLLFCVVRLWLAPLLHLMSFKSYHFFHCRIFVLIFESGKNRNPCVCVCAQVWVFQREFVLKSPLIKDKRETMVKQYDYIYIYICIFIFSVFVWFVTCLLCHKLTETEFGRVA